jgi:hypothetical protein
MNRNHTATAARLTPRCPHCAEPLQHLDGESYCASCTSFTILAEPPPPTNLEPGARAG